MFQSLDIDQSRQPDYLESIDTFAHSSDSFDVIFMLEVLEHVKEPKKAVANIFRLLKPSGRLIASVPFLLPVHDSPDDYFRFTSFGLKHLLSAFESVSVSPRNGYFEAINVQVMRILVSPQGMSLLSMFLACWSIYCFRHAAAFLDWRIKIDTGTTGYTIIANKPAAMGQTS
jgi:SAM-dependent methyltransferase